MTATSKRRTRPVLHAATVIALLAGSAYFTIELRKEEQAKAPAIQTIVDAPVAGKGAPRTPPRSGSG